MCERNKLIQGVHKLLTIILTCQGHNLCPGNFDHKEEGREGRREGKKKKKRFYPRTRQGSHLTTTY